MQTIVKSPCSKEDLEERLKTTIESPRYSVGIIGLGRIAVELPDNHLRAYLECPDTDLVAVCDIDVNKLANFREYHTYTNPAQMARQESLDIISICTPVETHCEITCMVAPFTHALYVEKPMATTLEECDKMIEVCKKHNVILQINHQRRFAISKMRFSRDLIDTGTHAFDLLRKLYGEFKYFIANHWYFDRGEVEIEYIDTDEHIFELDFVCNKQRMILNGVRELVACLDSGTETPSSGYNGKEALRLALMFKEQYERANGR